MGGGPLTCWCCLWPHGCSGRRRPRPPARLGVLTAFGAAPRSPPVPSGPSGALHTSGARCADVWFDASTRCPARPRRPRGGLQSVGVSVCCPARLAVASLISHVIPQRLVQMLNLHRWNCSVFGVSRKMTTINYVRNLAAGGVVADHGCVARPRPRAPQPGPAAARSPHFVLCSRVLHPIRRHCTPSDRVQCAVTGVVPHRGACG